MWRSPKSPFAILLVFLLAHAPILAEDEDPPTPEERVAELKKDFAADHAKLGTWASGKKLGKVAEAHLRIAVALDPDCRQARSRLGHRKDASGAWVEKRKKEWEYGKGAREKYGDELVAKEAAILAGETAAFEELGLALLAEGAADLGRRLCLRAHFLDPRREGAAKGLGLVKIRNGYGSTEEADAVLSCPEPADAGFPGLLSRTVGAATVVRRCGSAVAETVGDKKAADFLAKVGHQAQLLTSMRFGLTPKGIGWVNLVVASGRQQFVSFVEELGIREPRLSVVKRLGTARGFHPAQFSAGFVMPAGDPRNRAPLFAHGVGEWIPILETRQSAPAWLHEAVGLDACLTMLGKPGPLCVAFESSQGLMMKEFLKEHDQWPRLLLRRAGGNDLPRLDLLVRAQIQALGPEDIVAAHSYYRYLLIEKPDGLGEYLRRIAKDKDPELAFEGAFGVAPEEARAAFTGLLTGRDRE